MTTATKTAEKADISILSITLMAFIGFGIMFTAGFANSETVHNYEHDTRHAAGFPCH